MIGFGCRPVTSFAVLSPSLGAGAWGCGPVEDPGKPLRALHGERPTALPAV
ncbi:hypothetical protein GCM10017562_19420 [Streptomyces roseofulvus]